MKLSEICSKVEDIYLIRENEFETLGLIVADVNKKLLTFIEKEDYISQLKENVTCIVCSEALAKFVPSNLGVIVSSNPRIAFFNIHNYLTKNSQEYFKHGIPTKKGENCCISEHAIISKHDVVIGNNVIIEDYAIIRDNVRIGDNCIIRAGAIIGGIGFEFKRNKNISTIPVEHCGGVILEDNVEIQYNSCVDKAIYPWDSTYIGEYTKLDNLVHIGHAVKVGKRTFFAANALVGGRTVIGDDCWIGITTTIRNGLVIGNNASINMGAVVTKNVKDNESVSGNFAIEHSKFINFMKSIR